MKYSDLSSKTMNDLVKDLKDKQILLFELKAKLKTMQLTNTSEVRQVKKDIAKINTAITSLKLKDQA